jgi:sulfatase modifying factor 1
MLAIDFGTARTKVAIMDSVTGEPKMVPVGEDESPYLPTLFFIAKDGTITIGDNAERDAYEVPVGIVDDLKQNLRRSVYKRNTQEKTPLELLVALFEQIREIVADEEGQLIETFTEVILTHPAAWDVREIEILAEAAVKAGFSSTELISEPVAAAYECIAVDSLDYDKFVVLDCGAGTVDWAYLENINGVLKTMPKLGPGGNNEIGGKYLDAKLQEAMLSAAAKQEESQELAVQMKAKSSWFRIQIRRLKEKFNRTGKCKPLSTADGNVELSAEQMESITHEVFTSKVVASFKPYYQRIVDEQNTKPVVLLVGGATKVRGLATALEKQIKCKVLRFKTSDHAIVLGALRRGLRESVELPPPFTSEQLTQRRRKLKMLTMLQIRKLMKQFDVVFSTHLLKSDLVAKVAACVEIETVSIDSFMSKLVQRGEEKIVPPGPENPKQSDKRITNTISMTLNLIPAGTFMMGSPAGEAGRANDESRHKVTISCRFYMATTVVTQWQWKSVMGSEPWKGWIQFMRLVNIGPNYPATYVSWDDAGLFCQMLSEREGKTYRLPTEAEWEYACRAGTETAWSFGDDENKLGDYAWYDKNTIDIDESYAHQVGRKKPNAFGLYDMHGNVDEWCHDYYGEDYYNKSPEKDPMGPHWGRRHVYRGGGFMSGSELMVSSATRDRGDADHRYFDCGFRLVRELD